LCTVATNLSTLLSSRRPESSTRRPLYSTRQILNSTQNKPNPRCVRFLSSTVLITINKQYILAYYLQAVHICFKCTIDAPNCYPHYPTIDWKLLSSPSISSLSFDNHQLPKFIYNIISFKLHNYLFTDVTQVVVFIM
jgi:hypothetical protein